MNAPFAPPLTERELRWLRHIAVHGPQSSEFLVALCADTHRCRDTGLCTLQKLRETGYLRLPPQQQHIAKADFNPHVYDLTRKSALHLTGLGDADTHPPTGHWWHAFLTASITSAIAIEATRRSIRYIPAHDILARTGASLAIPTRTRKLIPDQLFALNYGGSFRSFVLEVDRGTEPYRSERAKKSLRAMFELYDDIWAKDAARAHYGLKSPLLLLLVFVSPERLARALALLSTDVPRLAPYVLVQAIPSGFPRWQSVSGVVSARWQRGDGGGLSMLSR